MSEIISRIDTVMLLQRQQELKLELREELSNHFRFVNGDLS